MSQPSQPDSPPPAGKRKISRKLILWVLGIIALAGCLIYLPCGVHKVYDNSNRGATLNNLKLISWAIENYQDAHGHLPPATITDKDGKPLYSWRVAILPFYESENPFAEFHRDEPWDSPHNIKLAEKMPKVYVSGWGADDPPNTTRFQVLVGPGTAFERQGITWDDFPDGRANTIMVVEAATPVPWTKPEDLVYDPNGPLPDFKTHNESIEFLCYTVGKKPSFLASFGDGSMHFIRSNTKEETIRALITRDGGERVDPSNLD